MAAAVAARTAVASTSSIGSSSAMGGAVAAEDQRTAGVVTPSAAAARSPYKAPGGRWARFRTYSVWQVGL